MSLWTKAQQLQGDALQQVRAVYGEHFPIEVRHFLAHWIEEKMWTDIDPENPQHERYISELIGSFICEVENKANSLDGDELFLTRLKLIEAASFFKQRYSYNPVNLFRIIRHCLLTERRLVQQQMNSVVKSEIENTNGLFPFGDTSFMEINQQMETFRSQTQESSEEIRKLDAEQESFSLKYYEVGKLNGQLQQMKQTHNPNQEHVLLLNKFSQQKVALESHLQEKIKNLSRLQIHVVEKLKERYVNVSALQSRVLDNELLKWKRNQQLAGNGSDFDTSHLDVLQAWCEGLAEIIWANRTQVKELKRLSGLISQYIPDLPGIKNSLYEFETKLTELLSTLVTSTFIIEKQPPQVMKTNTRFSAKVRLLVGGKLNVHMTPPQVKVSIISESQANYLLTEKVIKGDVSGDILNNIGTMEYEQTSKQLSITFRNMQLKKIKRAEKKGSESVVDEKFSLYFSSQFSVGGGELVFQVWTLSLPVTVIVHGNQEPHAWATITWDNAFAEPGRKPFVVPDKVPWAQVANALNLKFTAATGRPLSDENLKYLAEKVFRMQSDDYDKLLLSWSQFSKESLVERNFTFWDWFYAIMKLTREHLRSPWMDGHILGFARKKQAEDMLSNCSSGTFLLRFSDSELGGITIAWVGGGKNGEEKVVFMLQPFTAKDFAIRSLADRLYDLTHLHYLYPDIPKEKAFGRYYTPFTETQPSSVNGYVKPLLITHVPGWGGPNSSGGNLSGENLNSGINSYPSTPQTMFHPHSPGDTASVISEAPSRPGGEMDYLRLYDMVDIPMEVPDMDINFN